MVLRNSVGIFVNTPIVSIRSDVSNHFNYELIVIIIRGSLVYLTHYVSQRPDRGDVNVGMSSESPLSSPHHTMCNGLAPFVRLGPLRILEVDLIPIPNVTPSILRGEAHPLPVSSSTQLRWRECTKRGGELRLLVYLS